MKSNRTFHFTLLIICAFFMAGCSSNQSLNNQTPQSIQVSAIESQVPKEDTEEGKTEGELLYEAYFGTLEEMLGDWLEISKEARKLQVSSAFFYGDLYNYVSGNVLYGGGSSDNRKNLTVQMQVQRNHVKHLGGGAEETVVYQWLGSNNLEYASIQSTSSTFWFLREYMCRDMSLEVRCMPPLSDAALEASEFEKLPWDGMLLQEPDIEFIKLDEKYYLIDREQGSFLPVMEKDGKNYQVDLFFNWLHDMEKQSETAAKKAAISPKDVNSWLPEGYLLGLFDEGNEYNYEIADMNRDGYDDILVEIRPVTPTVSPDERSSLPADNVYRKVDSYYSLELWILEGRPGGGYTPRRLEEDIIWYETFSFLMGRAYDGGFSKEYFVGRSPFEEYQFFYEYDKSADNYQLVRSCRTYSYDPILRGRYMIEDEKNFGQVSLPSTAEEDEKQNYSTEPAYLSLSQLEEEMEEAFPPFSYFSIGEIPSFTDSEKEAAVYKLIQEDLHEIADALNLLDEMKEPYILCESTFANSNILVMIYRFGVNYGDEYRERTLYRMYDVNQNRRISIRDVLSFPQLKYLTLIADIPDENLWEQYMHLEDPIYELGVENAPISVFLTQEGLGILACEQEDNPLDYYQGRFFVIPREYLISMEIGGFWDDVPKW